jgi:AcrR family transcriptional regulator
MAQRIVVTGRVAAAPEPVEGLRERKKRETRQRISDVATGLFLERGFDDVRVAEIAEAAGVSEKTVYNYFDTKESLLLDREEDMAAKLRAALGPGATTSSPISAMVDLIVRELDGFHELWGEGDGFRTVLRFRELVESTPSLRAAQRDMSDRLTQVAVVAMAERAGVDPEAPEPQIAGQAIVGLLTVMFRAVHKQAEVATDRDAARAAVESDVRRAARLIETGLWSFSMMVQGQHGREQLKQAGDSAMEARKQVLAAMREARTAWRDAVRDVQREMHRRH